MRTPKWSVSLAIHQMKTSSSSLRTSPVSNRTENPPSSPSSRSTPFTRPARRLPSFASPLPSSKNIAARQTQNHQGHRYCSDNAFISNSTPSVTVLLEHAFTTVPKRKSNALWFAMNPLHADGWRIWRCRCRATTASLGMLSEMILLRMNGVRNGYVRCLRMWQQEKKREVK